MFFQWDPDVTYRNPILILNGGYEMFSCTYPMLAPKPATISYVASEVVDTIEYPDFSDIKMKDDESIVMEEPIPKVDRTSKQAAEQIYDVSQRKMDNVREAVKAEKKWRQITQQNDSMVYDDVLREENELIQQQLDNELIARADKNLEMVILLGVSFNLFFILLFFSNS